MGTIMIVRTLRIWKHWMLSFMTLPVATILQATASSTHSVKAQGVLWLQGLGVHTFRYVAVAPPDNPQDLPFPNMWNNMGGPSIPDKFLLALKDYPN
jgi:hypothetical protein